MGAHSFIHAFAHSVFIRQLLDACYVPGAVPRSGNPRQATLTGSLGPSMVEFQFWWGPGGVCKATERSKRAYCTRCLHVFRVPLSRSTLHPSLPCSVFQEAGRPSGGDFSSSAFCLDWPVGGTVIRRSGSEVGIIDALASSLQIL